MKLTVIDTLASWADAVAALPAPGPLPSRTVLVPSERHAHALRRALARSGRGGALAGARFLGPITAALEVLRTAGIAFSPGEDGPRPARLLALFHEELLLEHFDLDLRWTTRGWDDPFAAAIADLEAAGLGPEDLPADPASARDLARVWARVADEAGTSFGSARVYREAAALLERDRRAWPFDGPTLALATGHEDADQAPFLSAIPDVTLALRAVRPSSARHLKRIEKLHGAGARLALEAHASAPPAPRATSSRPISSWTPPSSPPRTARGAADPTGPSISRSTRASRRSSRPPRSG